MKPRHLIGAFVCLAALAFSTPSNASVNRSGTLIPDTSQNFMLSAKPGEVFSIIVEGKGAEIGCAVVIIDGSDSPPFRLDSKGSNCWATITAPDHKTIYGLVVRNNGDNLLTYTLKVS